MSSDDRIEQYYFLQRNDGAAEPKSIGENLKSQFTTSEGKRFFFVKVLLVIFGLTLFLLNASHNFIHPDVPVDCYTDVVQNWISPVTEYFKNHNSPRHVMIIIASTLVDINMTSLYLVWIFYGKSLRLLITIAPFYIFRGVTQRMFAMKFPDNYIFDDPGFFSVAVPYFVTNDFFFSGHIGICTIFLLEFKRQKKKILRHLAVAAIIANFITLLVTRGHFIIDLGVGLVAGHYCFTLAEWIEKSVQESENPCLEMFRSREDGSDENEEDSKQNLNDVSYFNDNQSSL